MKRKELEIKLQSVPAIKDPNPELEQYSTPAKLAADILFSALMSGDIQDKKVADLGCGSGIFAIGAVLLGAGEVHAFDVDENIIVQAKENAEKLLGKGVIVDKEKGDEGGLIRFDVIDVKEVQGEYDTVLMNPPFGAQNPGADLPFLKKAISISRTVYTIHQSNTLEFLKKRIQEYGGTIVDRTSVNFPIPYMFSFHDDEMKLIDVTILKISGLLMKDL